MQTKGPPHPTASANGPARPHGAGEAADATSPVDPANTPSPSLTDRAARGLAWTMAQTIAMKAITLVTQIVLAWFLVREDYGVVALAFSVTSFIAVLQYAGVQEIVIQRHGRLHLWANAAFWLSTTLGAGSALLVAAASPIAAWVLDEPRLVPIMAISAVQILITSPGVVAIAQLQIDLRMRELSIYQVAMTLGTAVMQVLLARAGWGPYALVVPPLLAQPIYLVPVWLMARPPIRLRAQVRRWRYMITDSVRLLASGLLFNVVNQWAYLILGFFHSTGVVGLYFFGFNLSVQSQVILTQNLAIVLFPALSKLQEEPARLLAAFMRASRVLAVVAVPACLLQGALAGPTVRLIFAERWLAAIPIVEILSIGMAFNILGNSCISMFKAQGRFGGLLTMSAVYAATFLVVVTIGAALGGPLTAATTWTIYAAIVGPTGTLLAIRPVGGAPRDVAAIFLPPIACAVVAVGPFYLGGRLLPSTPAWDVTQLVLVPIVSAAAYIALARAVMPEPLAELFRRLASLVPPLGRFIPEWLAPRSPA